MSRSFVSTRSVVPPGGLWFFQMGDDRYESPLYEDCVAHVADIMRKHGVKGSAIDALADFMCPHMPAYFCRGAGPVSPVIMARDAMKAAEPYFSRQLETVDVISKRLQACTKCPMHRRDFCLHCHGYDTWICDKFGNRRVKLPADDASGCCTCAKTFEAVVASVTYGHDEKPWEGIPETCWRHGL